ncbi:MAG: zinc finger domain-containing protein, partial [Patescibacteria group bacterium]
LQALLERFGVLLDGGDMLALSDLRRFAKLICGPKELVLNLPELKKLGPEPLERAFTCEKFLEILDRKTGRVKQILLDQSVISGVGNIYADEILWFSKIHPLRKVELLKDAEKKILYRAIKFILKRGLRYRGTSIDDYRDARGRRGKYDLVRYVYQRESEPCRRCGAKIKRIKIAGRSAHFCPKCQIPHPPTFRG